MAKYTTKLTVSIILLLSFTMLAFGQALPIPGAGSGGGSGAGGGSGSGPIPPPRESKPAPAKPAEEKVTMSLAGVKIGSILTLIADREQKPIICEDAPIKDQTFSIIPPAFEVLASKYDEILDIILASTLRAKGYTIIRGDQVWKIVKVGEAKDHPTKINPGNDIDKLPNNDDVYTQMIKLDYADAQTVATQLGALKGRPDASYIALPDANTLIITDYASNIKRYGEIIKMIDLKTDPFLTEIRKLNYASSSFVKNNLDQYVQALQQSIKPRPGVTPPTPARVLFDERTNSVIIIAQEKDMKQLIRMVDMFDSKPTKDTEYNIIKVVNTNAEDVAKIVESIFQKQLQALQTSLKPSERTVSISPEKSTNSLIITAPASIYNDMLDLIKKLDAKKMQVLLEVVIAELTDEKMVQLGVELGSMKNPTDKIGGFGSTGMGMSTFDPATGLRTPSIPSVEEVGGSLTLGLWKKERLSIPFLLQASQKDSGVDLKAAPVLLTNDNAEASINMSDMAPYFTSTWNGAQTQTNFGGYVQAEIKLKITPYISEEDYIRLVIEQTSEQFLGTPSQSTPKTARTAKTTVTVPNKDTVVIGGLTRETKTKKISKVPLFGDIPLLGYLFRHTTDSIQKTHLCIFIKPNIMKESAELVKKSIEIREELERKKEPNGKK